MALLELTDVSKSFGGVQALRNVDFTLNTGQIHGLAGENGAGKSTMMKIIAGVHPADSGTMHVDGKAVHFRSSRDALAAGIGMVHQELSVAPELSVAENVFLGVQPVNGMGVVAWRQMAERAAEELKNLGLAINPRARLGDFPIGVQQLVELSRVLFSGARVIILDEPLTGLDAGSARQVKNVLRERVRAGGAIIMTTHILEVAERLADRIGIIARGKMIAEGTLDELRASIGAGGATLETVFLDLTSQAERAA